MANYLRNMTGLFVLSFDVVYNNSISYGVDKYKILLGLAFRLGL